MTALLDYYEVLQVSPNAEEEIIQAAYKRLAYKWHPDRRPGDPSASERMKLINAAYEILSDPHKRQEFDTRRRQSAMTADAQQEPEPSPSPRSADRSSERKSGAFTIEHDRLLHVLMSKGTATANNEGEELILAELATAGFARKAGNSYVYIGPKAKETVSHSETPDWKGSQGRQPSFLRPFWSWLQEESCLGFPESSSFGSFWSWLQDE